VMAGMKIVTVSTDAHGNVNMAELKQKVGGRLGGAWGAGLGAPGGWGWGPALLGSPPCLGKFGGFGVLGFWVWDGVDPPPPRPRNPHPPDSPSNAPNLHHPNPT
jgi:hypothetical protein